MGCSLWGFRASTITLLHYSGSALPQSILNSTPDLHRHYDIRMGPYAHSQHIKVLKQCAYIWYGCGMQSTGVQSINHHITTSLGLSPAQTFLNSTPDLHMHKNVRVDPYAHSQHITVLKHFIYIQYGYGMQSIWEFGAPTIALQEHHSGLTKPQFY